MIGSTPRLRAIPAQTPPGIPLAGSRRSPGVRPLLTAPVWRSALAGADPAGDQGSTRAGGERRAQPAGLEVDRPLLMEEEEEAEQGDGEPGGERAELRPLHRPHTSLAAAASSESSRSRKPRSSTSSGSRSVTTSSPSWISASRSSRGAAPEGAPL